MDRIKIKAEKLLLVEGNDDQGLFQKLIEGIGVDNIQVHSMEGKDNFKTPNLQSVINSPGFRKVKSLGIVKDADECANNTFAGICTVLASLYLPVPEQPMKIINGNLKIGVLIIPPNTATGEIEDLCLSSIKEYGEIRCIDDYFDCLKQELSPDKFPKNLSKAKIQAFLASREESVPHLGIAAQRGYFPFSHNIFDDIKIFLKSL
jgi:hypothetical protein